MKYQKIDQSKEIKKLRAEKAGEAKFAAWLASLDQQQYEVLGELDKSKAKTLKSLIANAKKRVKFQEDRLAELKKLAKLKADEPSIATTQRKWLNQRIEELEREHARAEEMQTNSEVYGADSAKLDWDLKVIQTALKVCQAELKNLDRTQPIKH